MIHLTGHSNQAGGCCCPECGNTCGFHPEYSRTAQIDYLPIRRRNEVDGKELRLADEELKRLLNKSRKASA